MRQAFIIFLAAAAECFAVDTVPVLSWTVDCQAPAAFSPAAIVSGETVVFQPQYKLNGRVLTLTNAVAVALQFRLSGETNAPYSLDGTIYNATNGQVRITWPSSNVVAAGAYDYKVLITGDNTANLRAFGQLTVDAGFGSATGSPPPYVTLVTSGMVAAAVAAHDADSNTVHGGFILTAYQTGTNAWNNATNALAQISAHLVESWQTVHGGYILTAWQTATNALAIAQQAFTWSDPTNGYVTASVTNGLVGAPTFQAFTGTVLTAESDPVWTAVSNTVTHGAALGATALQAEYDPVLLAWELAGRPGVVTAETDPIAGAVAGILKGDGFGGLSAAVAGVDYLAMEYDVLAYPVATNALAVAQAEGIFTAWLGTNTYVKVMDLSGYVPTNRTITVNGATGTLDSNVTFTVNGSTDAPAWIAATNTELAITITNDLERPQFLYATGAVSVTFAGLRPPQPFYLVVRGPDSLTFPAGTHFVGGASWQTNQANHFIVWQYTSNLYVNPVTTSTEE